MNRKKLFVLAATTVGAGVAGAGLYRATHPKGAGGPLTPDPGRARIRIADDLLDLPSGLTDHVIPTPDGGTIHAIEKGSGRPLVFLHGITLRSDVWAPQFHLLADRYRVIAIDLRGHGSSMAGSAGYGMSPLAADLATVFQALDLHDAIVVGHSMGGMTTMQFCGDFPEVLADRVAGLVLVATRAHQVLPPYVDRVAAAFVGRGQGRLASGRPLPAVNGVTTPLARLAFGDNPSPKAVRLVGEMGRSMAPEALIASLEGILPHDARQALRRTETPSLVVVGTRDVLTPVPAASHLATLLPHSELVVLRRAGHQLMQERPKELADLIDDFAQRV